MQQFMSQPTLPGKEEKKETVVASVKENAMDEEPFIYATKQEAKKAFKTLLEYANVGADWSWEKAMEVIVNDIRYDALKTLGKRKQAFNEYIMQRKKMEDEKRRLVQRKSMEAFMKMLEESQELTASTCWSLTYNATTSKALTMFGDDKRLKTLDLDAVRQDLFRNYLMDIQNRMRSSSSDEEYARILDDAVYHLDLQRLNLRIAKYEMARLRDKGFEELVCHRKKLYLVLGLDGILMNAIKLTNIKEEETYLINQKESLPGDRAVGPSQLDMPQGQGQGQPPQHSQPMQRFMTQPTLPGKKGDKEIVVAPDEEKTVDDKHFIYATKLEAKNAFKSLLESANVGTDWSWDKAMRVIINDKRYGALKTLGKRKQVFNEYLMQRKKIEAEKIRLMQRKTMEVFMKMLEESQELTASTYWSKALTMFGDDKRFKALDLDADGQDQLRNYLVYLQKKMRSSSSDEETARILDDAVYHLDLQSVKLKMEKMKLDLDLDLENEKICTHPGSIHEFCIKCGLHVQDDSAIPLKYIHKNLRIAKDEMTRLRDKGFEDLIWREKVENVIRIDQYYFFASRCPDSHTQRKTDESESKGPLANVLKVLQQVHTLFFDKKRKDNIEDRDVRQASLCSTF
ncbi:pre-mRNA-processing protein 40A-like [Salvia hispanica]|uniref:pre-mRNA-processing protein 40A-like n=1 Tax=Salvia hispanica TaxID=49212 RepID=UPI0020096756|nr:pre-mRNA-processing protein 40A-like [Salvia hispanica]